jgi:hypothetical protein
VLFKKSGANPSRFEPLISPLEQVVKHGKCPHLPSLKPGKFVRVVDASNPIEAREISTMCPIGGMVHPKGENVLDENGSILFGKSRSAFANRRIHGCLSCILRDAQRSFLLSMRLPDILKTVHWYDR